MTSLRHCWTHRHQNPLKRPEHLQPIQDGAREGGRLAGKEGLLLSSQPLAKQVLLRQPPEEYLTGLWGESCYPGSHLPRPHSRLCVCSDSGLDALLGTTVRPQKHVDWKGKPLGILHWEEG